LDDLRSHVSDIWSELLYGDQPAGWRIIGTPETISKLQRKDFVSYHKKQYSASNTTVVVAGNIDEKEVQKKVAKTFKTINTGTYKKKKKVIENQKSPNIKIFYKDSDQTHIVLGVRSFDVHDKRNRTMRVMRSVLSGGMSARLFQKMREELGICYYVYASQDSFTNHGNFSISAGVDQNRLDIAISAIIEEMRKLVLEKVTEDELQKIKEGMIGRLNLNLESSDDISKFYLDQNAMRTPLQTPQQIIEDIEKVTADEIQELAREIFVDKNLNLAIVGKHKNTDALLKMLTFSL